MDTMMALESKVEDTEFQAVVFVTGSSSLLHPLTSDPATLPKALLPVAGVPLLAYQLLLLSKAGFSDALVFVPQGSVACVRDFLATRTERLAVELITIEDDMETADALRLASDKIKGDFVVIHGDLVTEASLHDVADMHRTNDATVTMLLKGVPGVGATDQRGRPIKLNVTDYFGLTDESRVIFLESNEDNEGVVRVPKSIMKRAGSVAIRGDLIDTRLFFFSKSVMAVLLERTELSSVHADLVPFLVRQQFADSVDNNTEEEETGEEGPADSASDVRCFALCLPEDGQMCRRIQTVADYVKVNHEVITHGVSAYTPWDLPVSSGKFRAGVHVGSDCAIGNKVSMKACVIGQHCTIGAKAKLNGCVIMDHVTIGDGCVLQGAVVCHGVKIGAKSSIKNSQIGPSCVVEPQSHLVNEQITNMSFLDDTA